MTNKDNPQHPFERDERLDVNEDVKRKNPSERFVDPDAEISEDDIPPHMKALLKKNASLPDIEGTDDLTISDDGFQGMRELMGNADDRPEPEMPIDYSALDADNPDVLGTNIDTGRKIVKPTKQVDSPFDAVEESIQPVQTTSWAEVMGHVQQRFDYKPITLPSMGYLYKKIPGLNEGVVEVRPMRSEEEEILYTPHLMRSGESMELLLKRCVRISPSYQISDPQQLLMQDRIALFIAIRIMSWSNIYEAEYKCTSCLELFEPYIDLDEEIDVTYCDNPDISEPFSTVLPGSRIPVEYRLPRGYDDVALLKHLEARKKDKGAKAREDTLTFLASRLITSVAGHTDRPKIEQFVRQVGVEDLSHLRSKINYPPFGVDTRISVKCPYCLSENRTRLAVDLNFFTPSSARRKKSA